MTTHVLVESLAHAAQARAALEGPLHWHSTSPVLIERLSEDGEAVSWADAPIPTAWSNTIGRACRDTVFSLEPALIVVAERLRSPKLVPFVSQLLAFLLGLLCYKRAILEAFARSAENPVVIGTPGLTLNTGGRIGVGSFDTLFRNLSEGLDVRLLDGDPFDQSVLEKDFDRGTVVDRVLSLLDLSRAQLTSRRLRFLKSSRIGPPQAKATVFVGRDNDTIREMLPHFLDRSVAIARLPNLKVGESEGPEDGLPSLDMLSKALSEAFLRVDIDIDGRAPAQIAHAQMVNSSKYWRATQAAAEKSVEAMIAGDARNRPAAIITNTVGNLAGCLQVDAAERKGIPTITVEHGVSAGLSEYHAPIKAWGEPIYGTAYLACAENASTFFAEEPRMKSVAFHTVGLAAQTRRTPLAWLHRAIVWSRFRRDFGRRVIVYLARANQNNFRKLSHWPKDCEIYELQRTMCHEVMPKLQGRSVIKLYSTRHYIDGVAFWDHGKPTGPVTTIKTGDFRYFRAGVDIIILESPLSTIGWAFGTGRPIVYLADPRTPLIPEIRSRLAAAVFLIDLSVPNWGEQVIELINQPTADLSAAWEKKRAARDAFLEECVFGPDSAGARGAQAVLEEIDRACNAPSAIRNRGRS